jgi:hypothetical protein
MVATPGHLLSPGVRLRLQLRQIRKASQRQERALQVSVSPLDLALGLGPAGLQHDQAHAQPPAQGGHLWVQHGPLAHPIGHDRGVVVDHHRLGDAAQPLQAPHDRVQQVRHGLGQAVDHRVGGRVRQGGHPAVRLAGGAVADRDLGAGLPPVPVGELAGQVAGALVAAGRQERRADGGQVLLEDGDPAGVAVTPQALQDDRGRHLGVGVQHRGDGLLVRIQLGASRLSLVARRLLQPQQPDHRGAAHPQPLGDRGLAQPLALEQPVDLCPVAHLVHPFLLPSTPDGSVSPKPNPVWEVSSFRPARGVKFSADVDRTR